MPRALLPLILFLAACPPSPAPGTPAIVSFTASTNHLPLGGGDVTLRWVVADADSLTLDPGVGTVKGTSKTVHVDTTTTFTLTATSAVGTASAGVTIEVETPPGVPSLSANPATLRHPGFVTLSYAAKDAQSISIDGGVGAQQWDTGNASVWVDRTTTFTISVVGSAGPQNKSVTVRLD